MGKNKLSGSQNKKQAKEKEEKLKAVIDGSKKIDTFFCAQQKGTKIDTKHVNSDKDVSKSINPTEKIDNVEFLTNINSPQNSFSVTLKVSQNISDTTTPSNDPIEWLPNKWHQEFISRNGFLQNIDIDFKNSARTYGDITRYCTKSLFYRQTCNGEQLQRKWMIYSISKGLIFCAFCKLFEKYTHTQFGTYGFNDWKNAHTKVICHEKSQSHMNNLKSFMSLQRETGRVDNELAKQLNVEVNYWISVLTRVVEIIKYLASRGLAFRGADERLNSLQNGNFLGAIELLAKFDPFMASHITRYGNAGRGIPSYLSKTIYEELIILMKQHLTKQILLELKNAKYYSIIVDSTSDVSHTDQLCFVVRYCLDNGTPVERFLLFIENVSHKSKELTETVLDILSSNDIPISNCRGQSYDNARNMSGQYSGLQSRIKEINPYAEYVPCAGHSLNLVGTSSAESCTNAVIFFDMVQKLYNFFSCSTSRWNILKQFIKDNLTLKNLSVTRWSARADACSALHQSYNEIITALDTIIINIGENLMCKYEAKGIKKYLKKLECGILICLWNTILERFVIIFMC